MARLAIFTSEEQKLFNSPPVFNSIERKRYWSAPQTLSIATLVFGYFSEYLTDITDVSSSPYF